MFRRRLLSQRARPCVGCGSINHHVDGTRTSVEGKKTSSARGTQLKMRQSERDIQGDRSFDGDRLQSETPSRAPDQNVDARSETHANLPRGTDVFASKGSRWRA